MTHIMYEESHHHLAFITFSKISALPVRSFVPKQHLCHQLAPRYRALRSTITATVRGNSFKSSKSIDRNLVQIDANLPEYFQLFLNSSEELAIVSCQSQKILSRSHANIILTEIRRLQAIEPVQSFVVSVPKNTFISQSIRGFIREEGGEIIIHNSDRDIPHLQQTNVPITKPITQCSSTLPLVPLEGTTNDKLLSNYINAPEPGFATISEENHVAYRNYKDPFKSSSKDSLDNITKFTPTHLKQYKHSIEHSRKFILCANHEPAGDQPVAIAKLTEGLLQRRSRFQVLHGVTGSGKTFIMGNIIARANRPALVLAPNKTLAAQLYNEFSRLFPDNRVEYFVSHFKHYQPEAYLPSSDRYIAKSSSVDSEIDRLRHAATRSLFERNDTIVVASVSSIYGLGLPTEYLEASVRITVGEHLDGGIESLGKKIREIGYQENDTKVREQRGLFCNKDEFIELSPPWEPEGTVYRILFDGSIVKELENCNTKSGKLETLGSDVVIYPAKHFVAPKHRLERAIRKIEEETNHQVLKFQSEGKVLEATRLSSKVAADIDMMKKVGYCSGAENYSFYISGRDEKAASFPPETLLDYMPKNGEWLLFIDESHVTVPQIGAMHAGNAARKRSLIHHGFRLPSSIENRPLSFQEFWNKASQTIFVSATPGGFEMEKCGSRGMIEAVIRPTGIVDPTIEVIPTTGQIEHLTCSLAKIVSEGGKAIVTTITKKFAEDVAECLSTKPAVNGILDRKLRLAYLHSGIDSVGRMQILEAMRDNGVNDSTDNGENTKSLDVVVGVNLLREGIDLPAVRLVAILDADSEGFLRGETALIQMIGRAARNIDGHVIMYGNTMTQGMQRAIAETNRRRRLQTAYNSLHDVHPSAVGSGNVDKDKESDDPLLGRIRKMKLTNGDDSNNRQSILLKQNEERWKFTSTSVSTMEEDLPDDKAKLKERMLQAARDLDFETAALLRDKLDGLR